MSLTCEGEINGLKFQTIMPLIAYESTPEELDALYKTVFGLGLGLGCGKG